MTDGSREVEPRFKQGSAARARERRQRRAARMEAEGRYQAVNEATWREAVLRRDDHRCVSCQYRGAHLSAHHLVFKKHCASQYKTDVRNGLTLCNGFASGCHEKLHQGKLKIRRRWLSMETIQCLAEQGLRQDEHGAWYGPCHKYFA